MDFTEIRTALDGFVEDTTKSATEMRKMIDGLRAEVRREREEREALELKLQKLPTGFAKADPAAEARQALRHWMTTGQIPETRSMAITPDPSGGFLVPQDLDRTIQDQLVTVSPFRGLATVATSTTGDYEAIVGVRGASSGWAGETSTRAQTDTPQFEKIRPVIGEIHARAPVTSWLLDDAAFSVEQYLADHVVTEFAMREGEAFITGNGVIQPRGLLTYEINALADANRPTHEIQYIPTGNGSGFPATDAADVLINLAYALAPAYRANARWIMNSNTAAVVRKFKDGDGRYMWADALTAGTPNLLLGYPVVMVEDMPDIAAGEHPIAFGDFRRAYRIVDKGQPRVIRDEYSRKHEGLVEFFWKRRVGGCLADGQAVKLLRVAAA